MRAMLVSLAAFPRESQRYRLIDDHTERAGSRVPCNFVLSLFITSSLYSLFYFTFFFFSFCFFFFRIMFHKKDIRVQLRSRVE